MPPTSNVANFVITHHCCDTVTNEKNAKMQLIDTVNGDRSKTAKSQKGTRNRKHRRAAAKPAACTKPLMLSKVGSHGGREGG